MECRTSQWPWQPLNLYKQGASCLRAVCLFIPEARWTYKGVNAREIHSTVLNEDTIVQHNYFQGTVRFTSALNAWPGHYKKKKKIMSILQ